MVSPFTVKLCFKQSLSIITVTNVQSAYFSVADILALWETEFCHTHTELNHPFLCWDAR